MGNPKRARSWKRRIQPRVGLKAVEPVLYSTPRLAMLKIRNYSGRHHLDATNKMILYPLPHKSIEKSFFCWTQTRLLLYHMNHDRRHGGTRTGTERRGHRTDSRAHD